MSKFRVHDDVEIVRIPKKETIKEVIEKAIKDSKVYTKGERISETARIRKKLTKLYKKQFPKDESIGEYVKAHIKHITKERKKQQKQVDKKDGVKEYWERYREYKKLESGCKKCIFAERSLFL